MVAATKVEGMKVIEKGKMPPSWSAQCCKIYALKRGLDLSEGDQGTIYTDSQHAFGIVHTFGKIWEECRYPNSKGKNLVHEELIRLVLESLPKPIEIAVVHIKGHRKGNTFEGKGNQLADQEAKKAALDPGEPINILKLNKTSGRKEGKEEPGFSEKELKAIKELKMHQGEQGEWLTPDGCKFLNKALTQKNVNRNTRVNPLGGPRVM